MGKAYDNLLTGGFGYGKLCLPVGFADLLLTIFFPPASVLYDEVKSGFTNPSRIVINFILTALFYFPGLIHALSYKRC